MRLRFCGGTSYTGEQWDLNAGFYYLRARWYNPENGRFTSVDPWEGDQDAPSTLHKYFYANESPINFIDPTGEFGLSAAIATSAILGILAVQPVFAGSPVKLSKKYLLEIHMVDYYDDVLKSYMPFPGPFSGLLNSVISDLVRTGKDVKVEASMGNTGWVSAMKGIDYAAIVSHGSKKQPFVFPSLFEVALAKSNGKVNISAIGGKVSYNDMNNSINKQVYVSACNAAWWTPSFSKLRADSKGSTPIEQLLKSAAAYLKSKIEIEK